jgi:hypothetical protein
VPRSQFEEALAKNPDDVFSDLLLGWDTGKGVVTHTTEELDNTKVWPGWNPKKAVEVLLTQASQ